MSTPATPEHESNQRATVIFDFDGTLALGTGPLVAYATAIAERVDRPELLVEALRAIEAFEAGEADFPDGYGAVASVAAAHGVSASVVNASYAHSRTLIGTDHAPVDFPDGLILFFERIASTAELWLATNAPADGIAELLRGAGLDRWLTRTSFNVGKPDGLRPLLTEALAKGPVLVVGDVYDYDLAPAVALGAATALVGRTSAREPRTLTMRAASLDVLYPQIEAWAASAAPHPGDFVRSTSSNKRNT